jgi:hypothetical protein
MTAQLTLKVQRSEVVERGGHRILTPRIDVLNEDGESVHRFDLMCAAIDNDIQDAEGSGAATLAALQKVEDGQSSTEELGGNAWYTYIKPGRVWFEGQYGQGEGGEVSFRQYKLAVETYVKFLSDPEHRPIEVEFPGE